MYKLRHLIAAAAIALAAVVLVGPSVASALAVFLPKQGGTGTGQIPTAGQVLVGQSNGVYLPQATSTLGISGTLPSSSGSDITGIGRTWAAWGDSLTAGFAGVIPFPTALGYRDNINVYNGGVGGQTSVLIAQRMLAASTTWGWPTIIWAGRNDYSNPTQVEASIASMTAALTTNNFIVMTVLNASSTQDYCTGTNYPNVIAINNWITSTYPNNSFDVRTYLLNRGLSLLGIATTSDDQFDYNNCVIPGDLRWDITHLNTGAQGLVANYLATQMQTLNGVNPSDLAGTVPTLGGLRQALFQVGQNGYNIGGQIAFNATSTTGNTSAGIGAGANLATILGAENTAVGYLALNGTSTASINTAIGAQSLQNDFSGGGNSTVGFGSLYNLLTGTNNSAVGTYALHSDVSGGSNSALGDGALYNTTTGYNTCAGLECLYTDTSGAYNVTSGPLSFFSNTTGSGNIGLGYQVGYSDVGSDNIFAGYDTASTTSSGNANIALGYDIELPNTSGSNQLDIGNLLFGTGLNGQGQALSTGSIGVGTTSPWRKFSVSGTVGFSGLTAGAGAGALCLSASGEVTYEANAPCTGGGGGGGGGSGTVSTSSSETANYLPYWTTTSATPALLSGGSSQLEVQYATSNGNYLQSNVSDNTNLSGTLYEGIRSIGTAAPTSQSTGQYISLYGNMSYAGALDLSSPVVGVEAIGQGTNGNVSQIEGLNAHGFYSGGESTSSATSVYGAVFDSTLSTAGSAVSHIMGIKVDSPFLAAGTEASSTYDLYLQNLDNGNNQGTVSSQGSAALMIEGPGIDNAIAFSGNGGSIPAAEIYSSSANQLDLEASSNIILNANAGELGDVGIGTSSPLAALDVVSDPNSTDPIFQASYGTGLATTTALFIKSNGNVGVENAAPAYPLDVSGFINTDQYNGYKQAGNTVLYATTTTSSLAVGASAAAGWLSASSSPVWSDIAIGSGALAATPLNASAVDNIAIGLSALHANIVGNLNTAVGYGALQTATSSNGNTAIGGEALASVISYSGPNNSGQDNSAVGDATLFHNTTGSFNAAVGQGALDFSTTGNANLAFGQAALEDNTSGSSNIGIGRETSLFNLDATNTTAIGTFAAEGASSYQAQGYTWLGYEADTNAATSSDYNTGLGYEVGFNITTGNDNLLAGATVNNGGSNLTTGSNNICLSPYNCLLPGGSTAANQLNIGNAIFGASLAATSSSNSIIPTFTGQIGIGTTTPTATFSVQGNLYTSGTGFFGGAVTATSTLTLTGLTTGTGNGALCMTSAGLVEYSAGANCVASLKYKFVKRVLCNILTP